MSFSLFLITMSHLVKNYKTNSYQVNSCYRCDKNKVSIIGLSWNLGILLSALNAYYRYYCYFSQPHRHTKTSHTIIIATSRRFEQ